MKLLDHFDRVYVISLPCKVDRKRRLEANLSESGMASPEEITWVKAISGDYCPPPLWFEAGGGAWGCLRSHIRIMEDAIMEDLRSYCVLEDDACFDDRSGGILEQFMSEVPDDWGQLFLGGQHCREPELVAGRDGVLKCKGVIRTHAFAVHRRAYNKVYQYLNHAPDYISGGPLHVDQHLCQAHERGLWETYAPLWWIAGQDEGMSNISGNLNPRFWWHPWCHLKSLPFVYLGTDSKPGSDLEMDQLMHFGDNRKEGSREDLGLDYCVGSPERLSGWLGRIAGEALERGRLPGIFHSSISFEEVRASWSGEVIRPGDEDLAEIAARAFGGNSLIQLQAVPLARRKAV